MTYLIFLLCLSLLGLAWGQRDSNSLMRATWLPVSYRMNNESSVFSLMSDLKEAGVDRVYVDVWNQGKVYFMSNTMNSLLPDGTGCGPDYLEFALNAANKLGGMNVYAWFEYGLIAAYGDINNDFARKAQEKGWILGQEGQGFVWMDPDNGEVLSFLVGILNDSWTNYSEKGLKGVQLDDHFSSPVSLGKNTESMTSAMKYVHESMSSKVVLSLSPSTLDQALYTYNVDWNAWGVDGYYNEVIPQLYRSSSSQFEKVFDDTWKGMSVQTRRLFNAAGIRVDGSGEPTPWIDVQESIEYCDRSGVGSSVWYAHGIVELYNEQFKEIWGA